MSDRCHPENELWSLGTVPRESRDRLWCVTVLSSVNGDDDRNWSQRYKTNPEKLASGDPVQVVEIVRDLAGREASRGVSAEEKRMLAKARLILLQEG
jgi:CarD family transcriptional regulator